MRAQFRTVLPARRGMIERVDDDRKRNRLVGFKQSEDVSQIRRTCVRRVHVAPERNVEFLHVARAESLISQRLDRSLAYSYSHAGCSRWRWSDVTDTWDSSRAAGSRAPAERETNLNANQELQHHAAPRPRTRTETDFERTRARPIPIVFHIAVSAVCAVAVQFT